MKRLKPRDAALLRQRIERGEVQATLDTCLMIHGTCTLFEPKPASTQTCAKPGTSEKIEVMRQRVSMGENLWHPEDNATPTTPSGRLDPYQPAIRELSAELLEVA